MTQMLFWRQTTASGPWPQAAANSETPTDMRTARFGGLSCLPGPSCSPAQASPARPARHPSAGSAPSADALLSCTTRNANGGGSRSQSRRMPAWAAAQVDAIHTAAAAPTMSALTRQTPARGAPGSPPRHRGPTHEHDDQRNWDGDEGGDDWIGDRVVYGRGQG